MEKRSRMLSALDHTVHIIPEPADLRWTGKTYFDLADYQLADTPEAARIASVGGR